jgi:TRAP-type uncharacterized transport system fused permease subunit
MSQGIESSSIPKRNYIKPLHDDYTPYLGGPWIDVIEIFLFALIGVYAFTGALQGYLENRLNPLLRIVVLLLAFVLLYPASLIIHLAAAACFTLLLLSNIRKSPGDKRAPVQ